MAVPVTMPGTAPSSATPVVLLAIYHRIALRGALLLLPHLLLLLFPLLFVLLHQHQHQLRFRHHHLHLQAVAEDVEAVRAEVGPRLLREEDVHMLLHPDSPSSRVHSLPLLILFEYYSILVHHILLYQHD